jgi:hypothetical protein
MLYFHSGFYFCQVIVQYQCIFVLLHSSAGLATDSALLSLHVSKFYWM